MNDKFEIDNGEVSDEESSNSDDVVSVDTDLSLQEKLFGESKNDE